MIQIQALNSVTRLKYSPSEIRHIESATVGQANNPNWLNMRKPVLTSSKFKTKCVGVMLKGRDEQGTFLEFNKRQSKTRQGGSLTLCKAGLPNFTKRSMALIWEHQGNPSKSPRS